ncbi:PLP-dependent aminotransferase family protein [Stenotrophomonas sp. 24(2023)]|uniref:aminotransferase-like domain-containing protein n=1 Tax=Stenotrophomonas sp. 24(2023) TaxID=3068324 RepID=UPI0027E19DB1|nr:PLP-dependent aminotransferase family protein [Stenotrophomonas sp. 24(2023)]WMJ68086.1 PLP-dependent aminotransferase family protein [Stenotrophomonas sp. 24(2023)]
MARQPTRIDTVMNAVRARISARVDAPGSRLPSVRAQAAAMGMSVSTVVEAYERLTAEGVIQARAGSGFYVAGPAAPLALAAMEPRLDRAVDPLWVSRQSLEMPADALRPGCGWLPPEWLYQDGVRRGLRVASRADPAQLADYGSPLGLPAMRQTLRRRIAALGIDTDMDQLLLAESGTHAVDLVCRFLLKPGDIVLVDDPSYFNFHALLKAHQVQVVGVPYTPTGPDLDAFATALQEHRPRLYVTNAGLHNPTSAVLSATTAHRLLGLAERSDLIIVEDDIFTDFELSPAPRLAAMDGLQRVIHVGSFSKTVSAAMRCGYIAARHDWIDALTDLKLATAFGGGHLAAHVTHIALTDSGYRRHMQGVRSHLADARRHTLRRLQPLGIQPWLQPDAGLFLWCRLPDGMDAAELARHCLRENVVLAPGNAFSQSQGMADFLRFNAAQCRDPRVFQTMARAMQAMARGRFSA